AKRVSIDYAQAYFQAIAVVYLRLGRPYRRLQQLLTIAMKFVYSETEARWKGLDFADGISACLPEVRTALLDRRDQLLAQSLQPQPQERPRPQAFSRRIQEISTRSKQQIHQSALA